LTENQELNIKIFQNALILSKENRGKKVESLMEKWTHTDIINGVCKLELESLGRLEKDNFRLKDHQYYSLYRDTPNYGCIQEHYTKEMLEIKKQYTYVAEDSSLLLSMSNESLQIFRFILKSIFDEESYRDNIPDNRDDTARFLTKISETWALLYFVENSRENVLIESGDAIDMILDVLDYFQLDDAEGKHIVQNLNIPKLV